MEISEVLSRLKTTKGTFPREAVDEAIARPAEVTPALLDILAQVAAQGADFDIDAERLDHFYALLLLAQFRETRACPLVLRIAELQGDELELLFGDLITESLERVLASVCGGDISGIKALIENPEADEWSRSTGFGALLVLVSEGVRSREEVISYFSWLFHGGLRDRNEIVWSELVSSCADLYPAELLPEIEKAYADNLIDPSYIGMEDVRRDLEAGKDAMLARLANSPHYRFVTDAAGELESWDLYVNEKELLAQAGTDALAGGKGWDDEIPLPYRRETPKVGRNDPCPCGSGKKFKKCCGQ